MSCKRFREDRASLADEERPGTPNHVSDYIVSEMDDMIFADMCLENSINIYVEEDFKGRMKCGRRFEIASCSNRRLFMRAECSA